MSSLQSGSGGSTPKNKYPSSMLSQTSFASRSSPSKYRTKKKKAMQVTLVKRGFFRVFDNDGIERTPKLLYDSDYQILEEWQPTVLDYVDADLVSDGSLSSLPRTLQQANTFLYGSRQQHSRQYSQMSFTNIANVDSYKDSAKTQDSDYISEPRSEEPVYEAPPSAFRLPVLPSREFYPPHSKVPLIVKETESFTLFSMKSVVEKNDSQNADALREDNEFYESITTGKGKYTRKLNTSEQQTPTHINTSEACLCPKILTKNESSWVTIWKIYDEYLGIKEDKKNYQGISIEGQWAHLNKNEKLFNQSLIMERILGSSIFRDLQLTYKKSLQLDPMNLDAQFLYSAKTLWVYETNFTNKKPVTSVAVNTLFPEIIAVGHGKFFYPGIDEGFICVWCVKNPKCPERFYKFNSSVKCLDFATWTPNVLAASFLNGDLLILDISSKEKKILCSKKSIVCNTYERIIFINWWIFTDIFGEKQEKLIVTTGDGRIIKYGQRLDELVPFEMMRITKLEGKVKGIDYLKKCEAEEIPMLRFPAARCVVRYPNDHQFYLVSADDGAIHKCSTNFFTQHVEAFLAHSGPVYALKFSPFCNKIFLTCGADGAIRLWAWDIFEPLITLTIGTDSIEDAAWSPRNSTIIASISDCNLDLWDLRRKTYRPASTIVHPEKIKFCSLQFTKNGDNIILGDIEGSVYVMALYGMPFEEKFKEDILASCIEKELIVKSKLLKLLKKSGPPFSP